MGRTVKKHKETMWALKTRNNGFICGTYLKKSDAIKDYVMNQSDDPNIKTAWQSARNKGIRAVKVHVKEI